MGLRKAKGFAGDCDGLIAKSVRGDKRALITVIHTQGLAEECLLVL